ncbi:MAG: hypothetical protein DRI79_04980 [Chloroflexi bacterium]|nr:MAG: hypothetical protein DRI79_04980 [Chloroflexota bacterium]
MSDVHPEEIELARFDDGGAGAGITEHLRQCVRCRNVVADYRWLRREIAATLALAAEAVPMPRPKWWAVQERMFLSQRRQIRWHASAAAGVMLAVCLILFVSNFLGPAIAVRMPQPEVVVMPAPVTAVASAEHPVSGATPTPVISGVKAESLPTPAFVPLPTAPQPEISSTEM